MKKRLVSLLLVLVLICSFGTMSIVSAADVDDTVNETEESTTTGVLAALPDGTYTYVSGTPTTEAGSGVGQVQFNYFSDTLNWVYGAEEETVSGSMLLSGDIQKFFQGVYLSDLPVTDWFGSAPKDTEGYLGDVSGNLDITLTNGLLERLDITYAGTRVTCVLDQSITAETLTVTGLTRGQPNLLQSCITLLGSVNSLYLNKQGDVIMDNLTIGHDSEGVGLQADKIGGDTFIVGTVFVDGIVNWNNGMGCFTALSTQPGTIETNGQDIYMTGGSNIGRVGRETNFSTGEGGGNIYLGNTITADQSRGGTMSSDGLSDYLTISTTGSITAGTGDVIIGANNEQDNKGLVLDTLGDIQGNNIVIAPYDYGTLSGVNCAIGNIDATGNVTIKATDMNSGAGVVTIVSSSVGTGGIAVTSEADATTVAIGTITAGGDVTLTANEIYGTISDITAGGTVTVDIGGVLYDTLDDLNITGADTSVNVDKLSVFPDVASDDWYYYAATYLELTGIINGTDEGLFASEVKCTRGQIIQVLYNMAGTPDVSDLENPFEDLTENDWYYDAAVWAYDQGVTTGTSTDAVIFSGDAEITRQELVTMLYNYTTETLGVTVTVDQSALADYNTDGLQSWATTAMAWAVSNGVMNGDTSGNLQADGTAQRSDMAQLIYNYITVLTA